MKKNVFCLGDSLTFGARDEYERGYPAELSRLFWEKNKRIFHCYNAGYSGETSGQLLRHIWKDLALMAGLEHTSHLDRPFLDSIALCMLGTNDTVIQTSPEIYKDNMRQILSLLEERFYVIGIGLLPPVYGPGLSIYPSNSQDLVDEYNKKLLELKSDAVFFADFRNMQEYIIDTVHFENNGYVEMANIWYNAMVKIGL